MCRNKNYEPLFTEYFKEAVSDSYFVDKTMFLKEYMDRGFHQPATLITRPRGFGKSLTLSMVKTFFEKTEEDNSVYFKDLAIWSCGEKYTSEQGKYPVIYVDLTDLSCETYKEMEERFAEKMSAEFLRHTELSEEGVIDKYWLRKYTAVVEKKTAPEFIPESVGLLTRLLYGCDKVKPVVLVDGFDAPLLAGVRYGYFEDAFRFFKCMYSSSMKDNGNLGAGLILGEFYTVLANDFSGFNNVWPDTLISRNYADGFGFTEEEVRGLLKKFGREEKFSEVKRWYAGYQMENRESGFIELFNPDSVIRYLKNGCRAKPYREECYESVVMDRLFVSGDDYDRKKLDRFLEGKSVPCRIEESSQFDMLSFRSFPYFHLLFMSGYLTRVKKTYRRDTRSYGVKIPNREIREIFAKQAQRCGYRGNKPCP